MSAKSAKKRAAAKKSPAAPVTAKNTKSPGARVSADDLPRKSIEEAIRVAETLHGEFAGSAGWDQLADALKIGRQTNGTKYLFWSAGAYNLVNRTEGNSFSLAETGRKIVAPTYDGEDKEAKIKAVMTPNLLSQFFTEYDGHTLPANEHFPNVLERKFGVPRERLGEAQELIVANGRYAGVLSEEGDRLRIALSGSYGARHPSSVDDVPSNTDSESQSAASSVDWSKICFYVTPIGEEGSEIRKHADMMLKHLIEPVMSQVGMKAIRADKIDRSGLITQQIFEHLAFAKICVADLSFGNPNAFYELGVRHMCLSPVVQIIRKGDKIPFDVAQGRTITIDTSDIYTVMDKFDSARKELAEHVKSILADKGGKAPEDNPIAVYLPGVKVTLPKNH
jgi:hypothetical protein